MTQTGLAIIIISLLVLAAGAILWARWRKNSALEAAIRALLPWLVTEAERIFGAGTGPIKLSWVIDKIYEKLPEALTARVSQEKLAALVDKALDMLRPLWEDKPWAIINTTDGGAYGDAAYTPAAGWPQDEAAEDDAATGEEA